MIQTIVTHPGGAHKDDLLAVCVLIARHRAPVFRRDPTDDDLNDESVAVVDIGASHDPAKSNFDHHHFDRDHPPTCALSLVLQHLGLHEDALHFCDWLEVAEWFDSRCQGRSKSRPRWRRKTRPPGRWGGVSESGCAGGLELSLGAPGGRAQTERKPVRTAGGVAGGRSQDAGAAAGRRAFLLWARR